MPSEAFLDFEERVKQAIRHAERVTAVPFSRLKTLVDAQGAVYAAKQLLGNRERFSIGFRKLADSGLLQCTVEQIVVDFSHTNLFTPEEVETARWRLANIDKSGAETS